MTPRSNPPPDRIPGAQTRLQFRTGILVFLLFRPLPDAVEHKKTRTGNIKQREEF